MTAAEFPDLPVLIATLAMDAVNTQVLLDEGHARDREAFARLLADSPPEQQQFLRPLAPSHLKIGRMELQLSAMLSVSTEHKFSIQALPLNLEASIRHRLDATRYARIGLCVEQVPLKLKKENADVRHE